MKIKVTAEDIKKGIKGNCFKCPVARAAKRIMKKKGVEAGYVFIGQRQEDGRRYITPKFIDTFIHDFDNGEPVKPFEIELTERY